MHRPSAPLAEVPRPDGERAGRHRLGERAVGKIPRGNALRVRGEWPVAKSTQGAIGSTEHVVGKRERGAASCAGANDQREQFRRRQGARAERAQPFTRA
ncbi:MAG: hypothetical protein HY744_20975, partial [Deltaproteobacteria bacterium]|nr:hypothetical protein [Deltaproteobacteria bacterium]